MAQLAYTSDEAIHPAAVRARVEEVSEERLVFREAFRGLSAGNIESNVMEVPVMEDSMNRARAVPEGTEYPRDEENFRKVRIPHQKYGKEVRITDEAIADNRLDAVAEQADQQARKMAEGLERGAWTVLNNNLNEDGPIGTNDGTLTYNQVVQALVTLSDAPYNFDPDALFVGAQGMGDLLTSEEFTQASDLGDRTITNGTIGTIAGIETMVSGTGDLSQGEAIMVDSDYYGYESTREAIDTERYDKRSIDSRVIKIRCRKGWEPMKEEAAIKITG